MSSAKDLNEAIQALTQVVQTNKREPMKPRGAAGSEESAALYAGTTKASTGGGGIASPLVEQDYADRTFHPDVTLTSTDGLFTIKIKPVNNVKMVDANNAICEFKYKAPV
jgi:hypothetical protein